jgi:1,4-dihydroxy-2-naphthoate octaprenyltransferase
MLFVASYYSAVNLWNHFNDAEEDIKSGRKESAVLMEMGRKITVIVVLFYTLAFTIIYIMSGWMVALIYLIAALTTWLYSDRIFAGKRFKRLKEHYATEILTYLIVVPLSALVLWSLFEVINSKAFGFAIVVSLCFLSAVVMKDLKDITADEEAGYKTLAVVFSPGQLIKASLTLNFLYYLSVAIFSVTIFPISCLIALIPITVVTYVTVKLAKNNWKIAIENAGLIKAYIFSYLSSLLLLCGGAFYGNFLVS